PATRQPQPPDDSDDPVPPSSIDPTSPDDASTPYASRPESTAESEEIASPVDASLPASPPALVKSTSAHAVAPNHATPSFTMRTANRFFPGVLGAVSATSNVVVEPCPIVDDAPR